MTLPEMPIRSYLYVPGNDRHRIEKALATDTDAIILDLEDAVAPNRKQEAREVVSEVLRAGPAKPIFVRVNAPGSEFIEQDIKMIAGPNLAGIRLPKTESAEDVESVALVLEGFGCAIKIQCLVESAIGLELAFEIARAHESITGMSLGEADLAADLGVQKSTHLTYARSKIVTASRAAGLPHPVQSVYTDVRDTEELRRSTEEGKSMGFIGRSAIHPAQIPIINEVFTPTDKEAEEAKELLERLDNESASGTGAFLLEDGRFVDRAVV
ncbi:MAG: CoA ester lyase, partial [Rubrobacteraceae bacterium]